MFQSTLTRGKPFQTLRRHHLYLFLLFLFHRDGSFDTETRRKWQKYSWGPGRASHRRGDAERLRARSFRVRVGEGGEFWRRIRKKHSPVWTVLDGEFKEDGSCSLPRRQRGAKRAFVSSVCVASWPGMFRDMTVPVDLKWLGMMVR
ncbi:hypothetical protein EDB81DRAFT_39467 [Dactylonectria macrodidyma]|uniref:Uncharacterized protein n=1 Tax=Dactylonectria macrodidyma TaxID=307937 RepID=A0A9P9FUH8_9HYPO|nr:hypothetical protein EDB81DRAFT_39467 [Dactylonectria macrodidyma]